MTTIINLSYYAREHDRVHPVTASQAQALPPADRYPSHDEQVRQRLQDAAIACVRELGLQKVSMRHIAERAGLVRQTVYNYYPNKYDLVGEAFLREGTQLALAIAGHIRGINNIEDQFVEAFLFLVEAMPQNPILALMVEPGSEFLSMIRMELPFEQFGLLALGDVFRRHPTLGAQAEEISEYWSRNALSFLTFRTTERNREELERYVRRRLVPGLRLQEIIS